LIEVCAVINNDHVSLVVARQVLNELIAALSAPNASSTPDTLLAVGTSLLALVQPRLLSYEEQSTSVRELMAAIHERRGEWREAARALAAIPYDSGQR
jgi:COP9 signalosome complex subunit 4